MIRLEAEKILEINNFSLTNSYLSSLIALSILSIFIIFSAKRNKEIPGKLQSFIEILFESIYNFWQEIVGEKKILFFNFCLTFFVYIVIANWFGLLPGFGSIFIIKNNEKIPLLRSSYSDLNMTLALGLISVLGVNIIALFRQGKSFFKKFSGFVGIIELISEVVKIFSFSLRLFGNIFAGETLLVIIGILVPFVIPSTILFLELFVGLIQAIIFFTLTTVFISVALSKH
jgi:F-type H+-transporting ATPase subunit a